MRLWAGESLAHCSHHMPACCCCPVSADAGCRPGYAGEGCEMCPEGFWSSGGNYASCTPCPDNRTTDGPGATSPEQCDKCTPGESILAVQLPFGNSWQDALHCDTSHSSTLDSNLLVGAPPGRLLQQHCARSAVLLPPTACESGLNRCSPAGPGMSSTSS